MDNINIKLYHCTDRTNGCSIIDNGFKAHYHSEHWLGNGIYFYLDRMLAEWWSKGVTKKYTSSYNDPVILKTELNLSAKKVLDLRKLEDYKFCANMYKEYLPELIRLLGSNTPIENTKFICIFFDIIRMQFDYEVIIGTFLNPKQGYLDGISNEINTYNGLFYIENQVCLSEKCANECKNAYIIMEEV